MKWGSDWFMISEMCLKTTAWIFRFSTCMFVYMWSLTVLLSVLTLISAVCNVYRSQVDIKVFSLYKLANWHLSLQGWWCFLVKYHLVLLSMLDTVVEQALLVNDIYPQDCPIFMTDYFYYCYFNAIYIETVGISRKIWDFAADCCTTIRSWFIDGIMIIISKEIITSNIIHVIRILTTKSCFSKYVKYQHMNSLSLSASLQCVYAQTLH